MTSKPGSFPCNTCSITFKTSELQRSHMRQDWHVSNLRRRVAKLPAIPEKEYDTRAKDGDEQGENRVSAYDPKSDSDVSSEHVRDRETSYKKCLTRCLFCNTNSATLDANIDHMSLIHGLFIPSPDRLSDMESFLGYLAIIVFQYNECLYCGLEKVTADGVQTHMRDKGHCMINMNAESELLDFWELSDGGIKGHAENTDSMKSAAIKLSRTEMRLPSGAVINSRVEAAQLRAKQSHAHSRTKTKREEPRTITTGQNEETVDESQSRPSCSNDRRVAVRGEMGLAGISESQRRALQITEKKMQKREAIAKAARRYAAEQEPIKAKYYKTEAPIYQAG